MKSVCSPIYSVFSFEVLLNMSHFIRFALCAALFAGATAPQFSAAQPRPSPTSSPNQSSLGATVAISREAEAIEAKDATIGEFERGAASVVLS